MVKKLDSGVVMMKNVFERTAFTKKNVVGVAVGNKVTKGKKTRDQAIVVLVEKKQPPAALSQNDLLPRTLTMQGVRTPVDVLEVGRIEAQKTRTDKWRPIVPGISIAHYKVTAGTLGAIVTDVFSGDKVILSNNHVIANSNNAKGGDDIYQPGPIDGGTKADKVATLRRFIEIGFEEEEGTCSFAELYASFGNWLARFISSSHRVRTKRVMQATKNYVDAAIAVPTVDFIEDIYEIGEVVGTEDAYLGLKVQKSGRTTGLTEGEITHLNVTVEVNYGDDGTAVFADQIMTGAMSAGGDSGSLLVTKLAHALYPKAVGLLFAGSNQVTIYNPIDLVMSNLKIEI